jgi:hypothetical protein
VFGCGCFACCLLSFFFPSSACFYLFVLQGPSRWNVPTARTYLPGIPPTLPITDDVELLDALARELCPVFFVLPVISSLSCSSCSPRRGAVLHQSEAGAAERQHRAQVARARSRLRRQGSPSQHQRKGIHLVFDCSVLFFILFLFRLLPRSLLPSVIASSPRR